MLQEIGSEFCSVPVLDVATGVFPAATKWYLSGRSALYSIIVSLVKKHSVRTIALPSWCCDSMITPFLNAGIQVSFYSVLGQKQCIGSVREDALLVMDYFGFTGFSTVPADYKGIVIRDVTHSLFSNVYMDAHYYFGSLRKWCGVWTGGFAWGVEPIEEASENFPEVVNLRCQAMADKQRYLSGEIEDKAFLSVFGQAEEILDDLPGIYAATQRDIHMATKIDAEYIRSKRRQNAAFLMDSLKEYCIFPELKEGDCPLFVPIKVPNRDALKRKLIDRQIYCPVHWPVSNVHRLTEAQTSIYREELSLICDQRYGLKEMEILSKAVREEMGKQ